MITKLEQLPPPDCQGGYSEKLLKESMDAQQFNRLMLWMVGQTMMVCDAMLYNHTYGQYEPSGCDKPHGPVLYEHDIARFLRAGKIID